ncbi:MAG: CRISPR-associated endonuclease Cas2 [Desulfobacteraceae bacterium]|nr:CRISPR-associated endonuclease Cas2 [Desulfobacteraceae bacterium]MBC2719337.1 CRISPR-associated endonuclease Cas2 [Desulfobacteraceae bacterium]
MHSWGSYFVHVPKDFGDRVQHSVFECLLDKSFLDKITGRIDKIIVEKEDSVHIYCLCANCEREIRVMGKGRK